MKSRCRAIIVVSQQRSKRVIISKAKVPGTRWKRPAFRSVSGPFCRNTSVVDNQYTDNDTRGACFLTKYIKIYSFDDDSKRIPILIKKENRRFLLFYFAEKTYPSNYDFSLWTGKLWRCWCMFLLKNKEVASWSNL